MHTSKLLTIVLVLTFFFLSCPYPLTIHVTGSLECLVRPLIPRPPLFGAVSCSFIDPPELDFSLSGLAAVGDAGLFKKIIQGAVTSTFSSMLVMPNRLVFKLDPRLDFLSFAAHPVGVLRVAALSGTGFPLTDESRLKQALGALPDPDVYLTLQVGSICKSTDRVDDQTDPVWTGAVHDFVLSSSSDAQQLIIKAYDYDVGFDDFLGYAKVRISDLIKTRICRIPLIDSPMGATPAVSLSARWLPLSGELRPIQSAVVAQRTDKKMPPGCSRLLLTVNVDEGRNLPAVGKRPFVRCQVGPHRFETWAAYELSGVISVCNPDYESSFHALLQSDVDTETRIEFSVIDQKSGQTIGTAYCLFSEVLQAGPNGKVFKFALMQCKVGASLRVRVKLEAIIDSPPLWEEILTTTTSAEQAATLTRAHDA